MPEWKQHVREKETVFREVWEGTYFQGQSQIICARNLSAGEKEFFYWMKFISIKECNDVFYAWPWLYILRHALSGLKFRNIQTNSCFPFQRQTPNGNDVILSSPSLILGKLLRNLLSKKRLSLPPPPKGKKKKKKGMTVGQLGIPWEQASFLTTTLSLFIKALELIWLNT